MDAITDSFAPGHRKSILAGATTLLFLAAVLILALLGYRAAPAAGKAGATPAAVTITVTAGKSSEYRFTLSKTTVPAGTVVFKVVNKGKKPHSFTVAGKKTALIAPGKTRTLTVVFTKAGSFAFSSTVKGESAKGMKGVFVVTKAPTTTTTTTTTAGACANPASTTVTVQLFEFGITLSQTTVPCGTVTFNVANTGMVNHNFDVVGVTAVPVMPAGASATATATANPGTFRYQCDVTGHAGQGMTGMLTVT